MILAAYAALVLASEEPLSRSLDGVSLRIVAASDGRDDVWSMSNEPLPEFVTRWKTNYPKFVDSADYGDDLDPTRHRCFLVEVIADDIETLEVNLTLKGALRARLKHPLNALLEVDRREVKYFEVAGSFEDDAQTTSLQYVVGAGKWKSILSTPYGETAALSEKVPDGHGDAWVTLDFVGREKGGSGQVAVASVNGTRRSDRIMRPKHIDHSYRLVSLTADGEVLRRQTLYRRGGWFLQFMLDGSSDRSRHPAEVAIQTVDSVFGEIEEVPLCKPAEN